MNDFDRFAQLTRPGDEDDLYHDALLDLLPPHADHLLDVGCGTGDFTRKAAARASRVTAIDSSAESLRVAKQQPSDVDWIHADAATFAYEQYDAIVSLKTLHHLPANDVVPRLAAALKTGGVLILHDVLESQNPVTNIARFTTKTLRRLARTGRLFERRELREYWKEHARHDQHPTIDGARELADRLLPGSNVHEHWLWRYTIVWRK